MINTTPDLKRLVATGTLTIMIVLSSIGMASADQYDDELKAAVAREDWVKAVRIVDMFLKRSPNNKKYQQYRQQLVNQEGGPDPFFLSYFRWFTAEQGGADANDLWSIANRNPSSLIQLGKNYCKMKRAGRSEEAINQVNARTLANQSYSSELRNKVVTATSVSGRAAFCPQYNWK